MPPTTLLKYCKRHAVKDVFYLQLLTYDAEHKHNPNNTSVHEFEMNLSIGPDFGQLFFPCLLIALCKSHRKYSLNFMGLSYNFENAMLHDVHFYGFCPV